MDVSSRIGNVRASAWVIFQAVVAATLAYAVATYVVGHKQPFFAPIAATSVVAVSVGDRFKRSRDLLIGNAVGILLADTVIAQIGTGVWQLGVALMFTLIAAVFVGGGPTITMQSAAATILIATIAAPTESSPLNVGRFLDALVGGAVGLVVCALILPTNPIRVIRRSMRPVVGAISGLMEGLAAAIRSGDDARAMEILKEARANHGFVVGMNADARASDQALRAAPFHWRSREQVKAYGEAASHLDNMLRNVRVAARTSVAMLEAGEPVPAGLAIGLDRLAGAARQLPAHLDSLDRGFLEVREEVLEAIRLLASRETAPEVFGSAATTAVLMGAVDLLMATGMSRDEALAMAQSRAGN